MSPTRPTDTQLRQAAKQAAARLNDRYATDMKTRLGRVDAALDRARGRARQILEREPAYADYQRAVRAIETLRRRRSAGSRGEAARKVRALKRRYDSLLTGACKSAGLTRARLEKLATRLLSPRDLTRPVFVDSLSVLVGLPFPYRVTYSAVMRRPFAGAITVPSGGGIQSTADLNAGNLGLAVGNGTTATALMGGSLQLQQGYTAIAVTATLQIGYTLDPGGFNLSGTESASVEAVLQSSSSAAGTTQSIVAVAQATSVLPLQPVTSPARAVSITGTFPVSTAGVINFHHVAAGVRLFTTQGAQAQASVTIAQIGITYM